MSLADRLVATWYAPKPTPLARALWPLSLIFGVLVAFRRTLYRVGLVRSHALRVPVIVVGNVTIGGAGKTPLALALANALAERGRNPGIVSRGYGGSNVMPRAVASGDDPHVVGDEPLLYARAGLPVWIGRRRAAAAQALVAAHPNVDVVIADDGLQHYALARTMEIVVVDAARELGNGMLLPAGPLREPATRLLETDTVVRLVSRDDAYPASAGAPSTRMWLETLPWRNLAQAELAPTFDAWEPGTVHAVAGIAHPERFFALLQKLGLEAHCHAFPDHHFYTRDDVAFAGARAILMTEKDAVKCVAFADDRFWYLPVRARIDPALVELVLERLHGSQAA
ncbi:MAG: tetraacyldisaccharide 4'-kinase [Betaproteobacteria bacterium]|nr:MAG: tetraacyldisaccharide 4'-kinase [Betaproteobacteria bacterium]